MTSKSRATLRSLASFYATPDLPTQDEQLAAAARVLAERNTAEDRIDIKEHIRRYHGGHLEPGESCPFLDKIKAAEEEFCTLDPKDADGDGNADFPEDEDTEAEVSEDSAINSYFKAVAKDDFQEEEHPRESKGGKGGGQFAKKPETLAKEDQRDVLSQTESGDRSDAIKDGLIKMYEASWSEDPKQTALYDEKKAEGLLEDLVAENMKGGVSGFLDKFGPPELSLKYEGEGYYSTNEHTGSEIKPFKVTYADLGVGREDFLDVLLDWFFEQEDPVKAINQLRKDELTEAPGESLSDVLLWRQFGEQWQNKFPEGKRKKYHNW